MNKKRKMLISIVVILIMLLNCFSPLLTVVNAETSTDVTVTLNSKLYKAIKASLKDQGISFGYNDTNLKLTISSDVIASITRLDLNESSIYNLEGLEKFTALTHLDLSGNNISKSSNLSVLTSLTALNYLDLSTNQLEDITEIDSLVDGILNNGGTVLLSNQTVKIVEEAIVDISESSSNAETTDIDLPLILKRAGFLKAAWRSVSTISQNGGIAPSINTLPTTITDTNYTMTVNISNGSSGYLGLLKFTIYIHDDATEAASADNLNPAASNILNGSIFYIYVVVHDSDTTGIEVPDSNMYSAIKEQLTAGQTVNSALSSYPYEVDTNGELIYDECTYETATAYDGSTVLVLTIWEDSTPSYIIYNNTVYEYDTNSGLPDPQKVYTDQYEEIVLSDKAADGTITYKAGYKVLHNGDNETLYVKAYDEPQVFVIDKNTLNNKITSLILNNQEIRDLTGLEKFVGLESNLNVSHNYLTDIDPVYDLQGNKDVAEKEMQTDYLYWLNTRSGGNLSKSVSDAKSSKEAADSAKQSIYDTLDQIYELIKTGSEIQESTTSSSVDSSTNVTTYTTTPNANYASEIQSTIDSIQTLINNIVGYDTTDNDGNTVHTDGLIEILEDNLNSVSSDVSSIYTYLDNLYEVYTKEYKLTTLLTDELNYLDIEEYETYTNTTKSTTEAVKTLVANEISRLEELESEDALSKLDYLLLKAAYSGMDLSDDTPVATYFKEYTDNVKNRAGWLDDVNKFRTVALYSEMSNYCLIKCMEDSSTASKYCYAEEYLEKRIESFSYEGIDTTEEETILTRLQEGTSVSTDAIYTAYVNWAATNTSYYNSSSSLTKHNCAGIYYDVSSLDHNDTKMEKSTLSTKSGVLSTDKEFILIVDGGPVTKTTEGGGTETINIEGIDYSKLMSAITIYENIKESSSSTEYHEGTSNSDYSSALTSYTELMALCSKLLLGDVSRYVTLPKLKVLDASYNSYLEGIERLDELTGLRELYVNSDYLSDLSVVDWNSIKYLRKLGFAYNYITDITPVENLEYLTYLDVSHNLLSGSLAFNFTASQKTLEWFDASYNQLEDITVVLQYLDGKTSGNFGNYLASEDTVNMDFGYQTLTVTASDIIYLDEYPETVDIELPKIFTQLKSIDLARTEYGTTSLDGRIESEGTYVTLNTNTAGDKKGVVEVIAMSGDGSEVDTCVGIGTKATIYYTVANRYVSEVKVTPDTAETSNGKTVEFTAEIEGENVTDKTVTWSIDGNTSTETTISEDGVLTLADDEQSGTITVTATSNFDTSKSGTATVTVVHKEISTFTLTPDTADVQRGTSQTFTLTIDGENLEDEDKEVEWTVVAYKTEDGVEVETTLSENTVATYDDESGEVVLTVASDETAEKIVITATSKYDSTKTTTTVVTLYTKDVTSITLEPATETAERGNKVQYTATVEGNNLTDADKTVTYSISAPVSSAYTLSTDTTISTDGLLTIGSSEKNSSIIVTATSDYDNTKTATAVVYIPTVSTMTISPETATVDQGGTVQFTASVSGDNLEDSQKGVTYSVSAPSSSTNSLASDTTISSDGLLTVGSSEQNATLIVTATSDYDSSISATATVTVNVTVSSTSITLGYTVSEDYIVGVKTKTPVATFKSILAPDYTVVVKTSASGSVVTSGYIATGMYAEVQDGSGNVLTDADGNPLAYEIVVKGDVNGDGVADSIDSNLIKSYRNEVTTFTDLQFNAADINSDGSVDVTDSKLLLYHRAEITGYSLDYSA